MERYFREEIQHISNIPATIKHQILSGTECYSPMHWHKDIEINLMLFGESDFTVDGKKTHLFAGDFIIINSGELHMGQGRTDIPLEDRKQELITLLWDYNFLNQYAKEKQQLVLRMPNDSEIEKEIRNLLIQIGVLHMSKEFTYEMQITAKLLEIGSLLLRYCIFKSDGLENLHLKSKIIEIQKAVTYMEDNCSNCITLDDVAEHVNLTSAYFSRRFKQVTGVGYHNYLTNCRLKKSIKDIENTNMTITEISFKNGFPNVKSYIEAFKAYYLVTPQKYREQYFSRSE